VNLEATMELGCRPSTSKFREALRGHDRVNLEAVIDEVWRYTWRP